MSTADTLIPEESTAVALALAFAASDVLPVPIRQIMDPATTPVAFLPFLAAHRSVDLWFEDWPEERKRRMVAEAGRLAALKGTRAAAEAFLAFVDTAIVHKRSYPVRRPVGRIAAGRTPIQAPPFTARFLLKTPLKAHRRAACVGRTSVGREAAIGIDFDPIRRAQRALVVSKSPETQLATTFAHRVPITLDDGLDLDAGAILGAYQDRISL